jgi:hypothetical protein
MDYRSSRPAGVASWILASFGPKLSTGGRWPALPPARGLPNVRRRLNP